MILPSLTERSGDSAVNAIAGSKQSDGSAADKFAC